MMVEQNDGDLPTLGLAPYAAPSHAGGAGLDRLAISASSLCLVHCLLFPILIAFLPSIAAWADLGETFHIVMLAIAIPLSGTALLRGVRRHGHRGPMTWGLIGLGLLMLGVVFETSMAGTALTVTGGIVLAVAHVLNLRADRLAALSAL
ncbi:MerC domain-containing protein [Sphingomonas sp. Marseille-Q8236]